MPAQLAAGGGANLNPTGGAIDAAAGSDCCCGEPCPLCVVNGFQWDPEDGGEYTLPYNKTYVRYCDLLKRGIDPLTFPTRVLTGGELGPPTFRYTDYCVTIGQPADPELLFPLGQYPPGFALISAADLHPLADPAFNCYYCPVNDSRFAGSYRVAGTVTCADNDPQNPVLTKGVDLTVDVRWGRGLAARWASAPTFFSPSGSPPGYGYYVYPPDKPYASLNVAPGGLLEYQANHGPLCFVLEVYIPGRLVPAVPGDGLGFAGFPAIQYGCTASWTKVGRMFAPDSLLPSGTYHPFGTNNAGGPTMEVS